MPDQERSETTAALQRLVGVYDADGSVVGEVAYFVKARFGRAHCSLCDITHGRVRERADWRVARDTLPVEFTTFHRDDQPDAVRAVTAGRHPAVVAETADGAVLLLGSDAVEGCRGDPAALVARIVSALDDRGLGSSGQSAGAT